MEGPQGMPDFSHPPLHIELTFTRFFFWFGACAGQTALFMLFINWFYGLPLPRRLQRMMRRICALIMLSGLVIFALPIVPVDDPASLLEASPWQQAFAAYSVICLVMGWGFLPFITVWR